MQLAVALLLCVWLQVQLAVANRVKYVYDPQWAAGIKGWIKVQYSDDKMKNSTYAHLKWKLDFSHVDPKALLAADGNCTEPVTMYMWHIHVKWSSKHTSESFKQCSLALAGNHYDPLHACGPNSEFVGTPECAGKTGQYACSPAAYKKDFHVCEKGDLSGKFGALMLNKDKWSIGQATDHYYPTFAENTPQWNIVLHAMCGKATPRVACAVEQLVHGKDTNQGNQQQSPWHQWSGRRTEEDNSGDDEEDTEDDSGSEPNEGEDGTNMPPSDEGEDDTDDDGMSEEDYE